ncbi:protein arginine methyltransferase NDUFAF7, mitochondrial-like isoform X2 [Antedon mediterranea]
MSGPISVAEYMKECLTNPQYGYYMNRDVFGQKGDFITSPEISQMFGELLGIWILDDWMKAGKPPCLNIVELGPGRGTLADDILRVLNKFSHVVEDVSLHLVEVSPKMRQLQRVKLSAPEMKKKELENPVEKINSKYGIPVMWHNNVKGIPQGFSCFVAHEFFDALPIHSFQRTKHGWREVLVDVDEAAGSDKLRFVLSASNTPPTVYIQETETRDHVEICPEAGVIVQDIVQRITEDGGSALIADYGHDGEKQDTLRAFKEHKLFDILSEPGTVDLTADVDFSYLRTMCGKSVSTYGPVMQSYFLKNMGIETRLKALMMNASEKEQSDLVSGYRMLTDPKQMGERFKFFAIRQKSDITDIPAGFTSLT